MCVVYNDDKGHPPLPPIFNWMYATCDMYLILLDSTCFTSK